MNSANGPGQVVGARPIVHVGLNKTATTWLQQTVFPALVSFTVVGRGTSSAGEVVPLVDALRGSDYEEGRLAATIARNTRVGTRPLLSDESITSTLRGVSERATAIDRLRNELPDAQILLVIREPGELLWSSYAQFVKLGGTVSFEQFCTVGPARLHDDGAFERGSYDAAAVIDEIEAAFGKADLTVICYEQLRADPTTVLRGVLGGIGCSGDELDQVVAIASAPSRRNVSMSSDELSVLRRLNRLNRLAKRKRRPPLTIPAKVCRIVPARVRAGIRKDEQERVDALARSFVATNRRLDSDRGLSLGDLGYIT